MATAGSSAPVKWVASNQDGLPVKRKQVAHACEACRKRKKRCIHVEALDGHGSTAAGSRAGSTDEMPPPKPPGPPRPPKPPLPRNTARRPSAPPRGSGRRRRGPAVEEEDATQVAANRLMELSSSRFISDLNPEGMFIQAATPALPHNATTYRDKNDLGVWLPPVSRAAAAAAQTHGAARGGGGGDDDDDDDADGEDAAAAASHADRRRRNHPCRSRVSAAALLYERAKYAFVKECLAIYPPDDDYAVLHRIYCDKVHPLLPVLKDVDLRLDQPSSSSASSSSSSSSPSTSPPFAASIFPAVVKQIIALSAAIIDGEAAAPHLRLEPKGPLLTSHEFHRRLTDAVSTILDADLIFHRFDYIRAVILLSFFYQPSAEVDRNKPSFLCTQAAYHFQTIGAHLLGYRPEQPDDDVDRTFCALWALDRLTSVLYARPCMMHAYDNGKTPEDCIAQQPPCFRLFMSVILWLDKVIHLYRPRQPFVMIDIPVYEALILDAHAERLPSMLLGTIEVLYHAVCVLSCRQPLSALSDNSQDGGGGGGGGVGGGGGDNDHNNNDNRTYLPISIMNPRRSHSSDRIVWVTQTQPICLFPFVPYAVSVALSVQYKKMRYSRTPLFRTRARAGFKDVVALLQSMGDVFVSARVNAALGESIWKQMEKTASSLAREELEAPPAGPGPAPPPASAAASASVRSFPEPPSPPPLPAAPPPPLLPAAAAPVLSSLPETASAPPASAELPNVEALVSTAAAAARDTDATSFASSLLPSASKSQDDPAAAAAAAAVLPAGMQPHPATTAPTTALLDLSVLDSLDTDIDLFGSFDPSFDLGAIDTALEANLEMGIPQNWAPWYNP